ncbi:MAG: metallophosphoesterase family protein [Candidatus Hodarchaeales archaeon]|jgi:exonuclease SbcD
MAKIVFISDNHIGLRFDYNIDVRTGISERSMDFIKAVQRSVDYAICNNVKIFVISGDFYENVLVGPTYRELVRKLIIKPLIEKKIHLVVVGGNHDTPMSFDKGSPLGELKLLPNTTVVREPGIHKIKIDEEEIGFVLLPYLAPQHVIQYIEKKMDIEVPREKWLDFVQKTLKRLVEDNFRKIKDCDSKILVGHYYFKGSQIRKSKSPQFIEGELELTKEIIKPDLFDLCVLGHIHLHQHFHDRKILIPGATERVDFGEMGDPKGFVDYDTSSNNWNFIENNPRPMIKFEVNFQIEDLILFNPTQIILDKLEGNIDGALVRIEITGAEKVKSRINYQKIENKLSNAFHHEISWKNSDENNGSPILSDFTLDPETLFDEYIEDDSFFKNHPNIESIKRKGKQIINDILTNGGD